MIVSPYETSVTREHRLTGKRVEPDMTKKYGKAAKKREATDEGR